MIIPQTSISAAIVQMSASERAAVTWAMAGGSTRITLKTDGGFVAVFK